MSMTTDPAAKSIQYLGRFYRVEGSDALVHAQRDTLNNLAVLAGQSRCRVSIVSDDGDRVIGNMTPDGLIDWFE